MNIYAGETTRLAVSLTDEDGLPTSPLPATVTFEAVSSDEVTVVQAATAMALVVEDKGTFTAATSSLLTDSAQAWRVDQWRGKCVRIAGGAGIGQERRIRSNTATALTLETKQVVNEAIVGVLTTVPAIGDAYELHSSRYRKNYDVPSTLADTDLVFVIRAATTTGLYPYKAVEKVTARIEGSAV